MWRFIMNNVTNDHRSNNNKKVYRTAEDVAINETSKESNKSMAYYYALLFYHLILIGSFVILFNKVSDVEHKLEKKIDIIQMEIKTLNSIKNNPIKY